MKIIWISNIVFPEACAELGIKAPVIAGWMQSGAQALLNYCPDLELAVASLYNGDELLIIDKYRIKYYLIPFGKGDQKYDYNKEKNYKKVYELFNPEIVHIHGSECPHSLAASKALTNGKVVLSIQGLVSSYWKYYLGSIDPQIIKKHLTLRDIIRKDTLYCQQKRMRQRGDYEIELIKRTNHIIGRTSWDQSLTWSNNSQAKYHFCNETLRDSFYNKKWSYDLCEKHTIFVSQADYPIKGIHMLLKAIPLVLQKFPDTKVYVAGLNNTSKPWFRTNTFTAYIKSLIKSIGEPEAITFVGLLNEEQMAFHYEHANVFVCPSSIENSPNSVGEAQLIGTPVISSYVGGTMDMIINGETGFLYRFEEYPLLAQRICELFGSKELCESISKKERIVAQQRHHKETNAKRLISIYQSIISDNCQKD